MGTKHSPSCFHFALDYFSKLTSISKTKEIYFDKIEHIRTRPHKNRNQAKKFKSKLLYKSDNIKVETECGKIVSWFPKPNLRFDECGYIAKRFTVSVNRKLEEFGVEIHNAGMYVDCLGGGWMQNIHLYRHNEFYFAPGMDCAHS